MYTRRIQTTDNVKKYVGMIDSGTQKHPMLISRFALKVNSPPTLAYTISKVYILIAIEPKPK